jgi:hypothetical protein
VVVLSVMHQIGVKRYREDDLQEIVRQAARDLMDKAFRDRVRSSPRFFGIMALRHNSQSKSCRQRTYT